jgi:hypothetical protein
MATGSYQEEQALAEIAEAKAMDARYELDMLRQSLPYEPTREEQAEYRQMLDGDEQGRQQYEDETGCTCIVSDTEWAEARMSRPSCPVHDKGRN